MESIDADFTQHGLVAGTLLLEDLRNALLVTGLMSGLALIVALRIFKKAKL